MRQIAVVLGIATLVAWNLAPATAQPVAQAVAIVPGKSIGQFQIGMPLERAKQMMEQFGSVETYEGSLGHGFCNPDSGVGVCVFDRWARFNLDSPGVVVYILTDDARFATEPGGHKVGQALLDLLKTFGLYTGGQTTELLWESRGLAADVAATPTGLMVRFIGVYAPRTVAGQ